MSAILVGAGGHAKAVVEALRAGGEAIACYVDPRKAEWLDADHADSDEAVAPEAGGVVMGLGGADPKSLRRRLALLDSYIARGFAAPPVIHPAAHVSPGAALDRGAIVLAGAVVQPGARLGRGAIVNTGAIVEHDSEIGEGAHIAPGAIVLGGCRIGACCMIGASAIVLPGVRVADGALVPAGARHSEAS